MNIDSTNKHDGLDDDVKYLLRIIIQKFDDTHREYTELKQQVKEIEDSISDIKRTRLTSATERALLKNITGGSGHCVGETSYHGHCY